MVLFSQCKICKSLDIIYSGLEKNYEKNMEILSKTVGNNQNITNEDTSKSDFKK